MNKQIRNLWEQSTGSSVPGDGFYSSASNYNIEKFANLIVLECMKMNDELKEKYFIQRKGASEFNEKNIFAEGEAACDKLRNMFKAHFGVEE